MGAAVGHRKPAGVDWLRRAELAALTLHGAESDSDDTFGVSLLRAIRAVFDYEDHDRTNPKDKLLTADLLASLVAREGEPWGAWWGQAVESGDRRGPGYRLGKLLRPFGIESKDVRTEAGRGKGFDRADFSDAFARYLSDPNDVTTGQSAPDARFRANERGDEVESVTSSNDAKRLAGQRLSRCHVVSEGEGLEDDHGDGEEEGFIPW